MDKRRVEFISIAKAIGIILVVTGHCIKGQVGNFIYLFHMPMFFMISGYLYKSLELKNVQGFIVKKIKTIYGPYVLWNLIFLLTHNLFFEIGFYKEGELSLQKVDSWFVFLKDFFGIFMMTHMEQVTAPTWYLRVLFVASILYALLDIILKNHNRFRTMIGALLYGLSFVYYYTKPVNNSVVIYSVLICMALFFLEMGRIYKKYEIEKIYNPVIIVASFLTLFVLNKYGHINIVSLEFENPLYLMVVSLLGTYMIFGISKVFSSKSNYIKRAMIYVGDHTMIILVLHCFVFKLVNVIYMVTMKDQDALYQISNATTFVWAIVYIISGVAIPLIVELGTGKLKVYLRCKKRCKLIENITS